MSSSFPKVKEVNMHVIALFEGYSRGSHDEAIERYCRQETFQEGEPIIIKGSSSTDICIVLNGTARAMVTPNLSVPFIPGQFFGELSFVDRQPRSVRVVADGPEPTRVAFLSHDRMDQITQNDPELARVINNNLLLTMASHVRNTDTAIQSLDMHLRRRISTQSPGLLSRLTAALS